MRGGGEGMGREGACDPPRVGNWSVFLSELWFFFFRHPFVVARILQV